MMAPICVLCHEPMTIVPGAAVQIPIGFAHRECGVRMALGGIGHHEDHSYWCENVGDPDGGRTYRQSAIEVLALWEAGKITEREQHP